MVLAKEGEAQATRCSPSISPRDFEGPPDVASGRYRRPRFINLSLADAFWHDAARSVLDAGDGYGRSRSGQGGAINVEYVSANPTGPMHVGHCRGAVFGDALANLLATAGYEVTREYYINDAGAQVDVLARSAFLRYREALGEDDRRDSRGPLSRRLSEASRRGAGRASMATGSSTCPRSEWLPIVRANAVATMMDVIRDDLDASASITTCSFPSAR